MSFWLCAALLSHPVTAVTGGCTISIPSVPEGFASAVAEEITARLSQELAPTLLERLAPALAERLVPLVSKHREETEGGVPATLVEQPGPNLDKYVRVAPNAKNALDIFRGEWSSMLPAPFDSDTGYARLFDDPRIAWAIDLLGGVSGFDVLELGPLEGGHTAMLEAAGAKSITAIEANTRAFLKCLVVKELLRLEKAEFLCGDAIEYLAAAPGPFDFCVASGILYHLVDPITALKRMSAVSDRLLVWTHYYDEDVIRNRPDSDKFPGIITTTIDGQTYALHRFEYKVALRWEGFSGGTAEYSHWLSRSDILRVLESQGFTNIDIGFDDPHHVNGPAFAFLARR